MSSIKLDEIKQPIEINAGIAVSFHQTCLLIGLHPAPSFILAGIKAKFDSPHHLFKPLHTEFIQSSLFIQISFIQLPSAFCLLPSAIELIKLKSVWIN